MMSVKKGYRSKIKGNAMPIIKTILRSFGLIALCIANVLWSGCATVPGYMATQLRTEVSDPFLIYKQDGNSAMGMGTHISMMEASSDRLVVSYQQSGEAMMRPAHLPWPLYSDDRGQTWQAGDPYIWTESFDDKRTPVFVDYAEVPVKHWYGFAISSFSAPPAARYGYGFMAPINHTHANIKDPFFWMIRSDDDGKTWMPPQKATFIMPDEILRERESFIKLSSPAFVNSLGEIFMITYGRVKKNSKHETLLFKSSDGGYTFHYVSTVATLKDAIFGKMPHGPAEGALIGLSDTKFLCIMRTANRVGTAGISINAEADDMLLARSMDAGQTWERKRLRIKGVMPRLLRMSNGVLVLGTGRPGNRLYFSVDEGKTWGGEISMTPLGTVMTSGYLDFREVEPGKLLVVYDLVNAALDPAFADKEPTTMGTIGRILKDVVIGPESNGERYNQIIGRYISVSPR